MRWGDKVEELRKERAEVYERTGVLVKYPALDSEPELDEYQSLYLSEFFALSAGRSSNGFGMNPLLYVEILSYLVLGMSLAPDTASDFAGSMRMLDNAYLKIHSDSEKSKEKNSASSKPPPKKR